MSFGSNGPNVPYGDRAILCNYDAADAHLRDLGTNSMQFGRQNGWLERLGDEAIGIRYHSTHVITLYANGDTSFNSNGWMTQSTSAWMNSNPRFSINLYEPRSGERKPYRYSTIRFAKHDRNIERQLREDWGMPDESQMTYIWNKSFVERRTLMEPDATNAEEYSWGGFKWEEGVHFEYFITDPILHERAQHFQAELERRKEERHPTYVYHDHCKFTQRGKPLAEGWGKQTLAEAIAEERAERKAETSRKRRLNGVVTRFTNRTMKALAEGLPVEGEMPDDDLYAFIEKAEPNGPLVMQIVARHCPGDVRDWLNFHEREGEVVMGDIAPIVEPIIRRKMREALTAQLV